MNGGTADAQAQPEDPDLRIGRPLAFHLEITPTDCTVASRRQAVHRVTDCFPVTISARERNIETT